MKILLTTTGIQQKAGTYTVLKNISPILSKHHEVTILTDKGDVDIECTNLLQLEHSFLPFPQYRYLPEFKKLIDNGFLNKFDIVHSFEYPIFLTDYLTKKKTCYKAPLIISAHGSIHQYTGFPNNILKKIHNTIMKKYIDSVSLFIASTNAEKYHLIKFGIPENKITVLSLGVNLPIISRKESDKLTVIYVGRLTVTKNIDLLIKAVHLCKRKDFSLIVVGKDFGMLKHLKNLVTKLAIENRVTFKGEISDLEKFKLFSTSTIFVHPSLEDIFSLSLIEAAGVGIPSIAFDVEANSEIFENNSGLIVQGCDANSLANSIDYLLNNKEKRNIISKNAIISINQKYNWNNTVAYLEKYYQEATSRPNPCEN